MNAAERKAVAVLAGIFALRMAGLFLLLPVLAPHAARMPESSPLLIGLALGVYGATQGALQIPFGMASDRFGRKAVITAGLLVFALGGAIAALAESIEMLILGRAIQGGGAVSAAALALTADLTRAEQRTTAMAILGVGIGAVFLLSLICAPPLQSAIGVDGIFWLSAALGLGAVALLWGALPSAPPTKAMSAPAHGNPAQFSGIVKDHRLLQLNFGAFALHAALTAMFVELPGMLQEQSGLPLASHWKIYAPVLAASAVAMAPLLMLSARHHRIALLCAVALLAVACAGLARIAGSGALPAVLAALWVFFTAFNALEAMLPSRVSRLAPARAKGAAIGVYTTCQFLGMFAGGLCGGALSGRFGAGGVFWFCAALAAVWFAAAAAAHKGSGGGGEGAEIFPRAGPR
ncbi:MAG: MFS transporter [Gammaproteobacteria bacterium]|nr:MFS transporter [Gammaproteobacteria bacterium]MDA7970065.1 MFS transporter [Gammaproteobacteria bacterium]